MNRGTLLAGIACVLVLGLAGCGGPLQDTTPSPPDLTQPTPTPPPEPTPDMTPPTLGNLPPELIDQVIAEAAAIAGVAESEVSIVRAEAVVWSDGSLGCPEPGQFYTQALVDGYWLVLRAGGQDYDFRASRGGEFRLCPPGQGRPPVEP